MAAFNDGRSIRESVRSIHAQTHADWELIIVDDASTDDTPRILAEAAAGDRRITIIRNDRNRGLAESLNRAFAAANGTLIARMDSDDVSLPERLARQVAFLEAHPEIDVVGTGAYLIDEEGRELGVHSRPCEHDALAAQLLKCTPFIHPSVMMRRRFLEALGGYDARLRRAQDLDLWWRGKSAFRYANLPEPLLRYHVRRRPTMRSALYASYVILRCLWRERKLASRGWYAARPLVAAVLSRFGLVNARLK